MLLKVNNMPNMRFRVRGKSVNATKTVVKARKFEMVIDEPEDLGGNDEAASPVEYLLSAFAGCINVMGHLIATELEFELRGLTIDIVGELDPARLFGTSNENRAGYQAIEATLKPDCDADEETLKKWVEAIESRCPVSDNLSHATPVDLKVKLA